MTMTGLEARSLIDPSCEVGNSRAAGVLGALALAPLVSSLLHGVNPADPSMLAMAPTVLTSIGILAAVLASARVLWAAPAETLRTE